MVMKLLCHDYAMVCRDHDLVMALFYHGHGMAMAWGCHDHDLVMPCFSMAMEWLWYGYAMIMVWLWHGYAMVMPWLCHDHDQASF